MILEEHVIKECGQHDARVVKQFLCEPGLRDHIELNAEEVVPLNVGRLDLNSFFFVLALLDADHLIKRNCHQQVHNQGRVEETNLERSECQYHQQD